MTTSQLTDTQVADSAPVAIPGLPVVASRQRNGQRTWSLAYFALGATPIVSTRDVKKHKHELQCAIGEDGHPQCDPSLSPIYDFFTGLAAFKAGTHEIDVQLDFIKGGVFTRPSGGLNLYVVPRWWRRKDQKPEHAMLQVAYLWNSPHLKVKASARARAGHLGAVVDEYKRKKEAKSTAANRSGGANFSSATSPPPLPTLPPETRPLEMYIAGNVPTFSRSQLLLTVRGHRILFLDTPGRAFSNKWIEWECRLLYPNYPVDSIHTITKWWWHRPEKAAQQVTPVEGVHYKLVMSHSDRNQSTFRLCAWRGANGHGNGQASVDVELLESLVDAVAPVWAQAADEMTLPSTSAGATDEATVEEVVFIVLAFIPVMTMAITTRRQLVQLWPLVLCLLLAPILKIFQLI